MAVSKRGWPSRDILEDLEQEGRIPEVIMLAWSIIEISLDNAVLREYGLSTQDPKARPLLDMRVADKLRLQKQLGRLSDDELGTIRAFKEERDNLFHMGGLFFPNLQPPEKKRLTAMAIRAADVAHAFLGRMSPQSS